MPLYLLKPELIKITSTFIRSPGIPIRGRLLNILNTVACLHHYMPGFHTEEEMINTMRPRQNGRHFADDTFKRIFLNENVRISIKISLKFVPKGPINNIPASV